MKTLTLLFLVALSMPALAQDPEQPGATSNVAVRGSLSKEVVREVIRRHLNEARYCYERSLQRSPDLAGRVIMRFTIDANGRVSAATASETPQGYADGDSRTHWSSSPPPSRSPRADAPSRLAWLPLPVLNADQFAELVKELRRR